MVELKGFGHFQHLVPVFTGAGKRHSLRVTALHACGVSNTAFFTETEQVPVDASTAWMMADEMMSWPLAFLSSRRFYSTTSGSRPAAFRSAATPSSKPQTDQSVICWRSFCRSPITASRM